MGGTQSTPEPAAPPQASSQRDRRQPEMSLDEKFDAVRIDHGGSSSKRSRTFDDDDDRHEHVSVSKTEEYVKELLKDGKNRLGLSTFSTTNPTSVLEKPSVLLQDTQYFNLKIPFEGSPVTNQRSSGRCWIFAACNVFRIGEWMGLLEPRLHVNGV